MTKFFGYLTVILLLAGCMRQEYVFDNQANNTLELAQLLKLDNASCFYDVASSTLKYSIEEQQLTNYSPWVHFNEEDVVHFENKLLKNNIKNDLGTLKMHKAYNLTIRIGDRTQTFKLVFTPLALAQLVTHDPIRNEPKILSRLTINYPAINTQPSQSFAGVEIRGASSVFYDKKSYGLGMLKNSEMGFSSQVAFFDLPANDKWILDGMYKDVSRLRNKTSFEVWTSLGADHIGVQSQYVELFINNQSQGLYNFTENYTATKLKANANSILIKGLDNTDVTRFKEVSAKKAKGAFWGNWEQKRLDDLQTIDWESFKELSELIVQENNSVFKNNIGSLLDLDNVIDYYLFVNLCGGMDNVGKNYFFFKRLPSDPFSILPWDLDATWGIDVNWQKTGYEYMVSNHLFDRLLETNPDNFTTKLKTRWANLRQNSFSEQQLIALFNNNFEQLNKGEIASIEREKWNTHLDLPGEQQYIHSWIISRLAYLDSVFAF